MSIGIIGTNQKQGQHVMAAPRVSNRPVQVGQNQHKNRFSDSSLLFSVCFGWYFEDPGPFLNCLQISVCVCV